MSSSEDSKTALTKLCIVLDDTSALLKRLTDQTEAQESRLHSLSPPDDTGSLAFVQAVLRHNLAPSQTTNLVNGLRDMRSEIQICLKKLDNAFQHTWRLYNAMSNGLARSATYGTTFSTTTTLTARINLIGWLRDRQGTCPLCPSCYYEIESSFLCTASATREHVAVFCVSITCLFPGYNQC